MSFGEPGVEPHYAPSRTVRIDHYDLTLKLFVEEKHFEGEARIEVTPLTTYGGYVKLDCDDLVVDAVTDPDGNPLPFTHDHAELVIEIDAPTAVVIRWHSDDPRRGMYFVGPVSFAPNRSYQAWTQCQDEDGHFVFPCHDHPGIKHSWTVRLEGPEGFTLLSNGQRGEEGTSDGRAWAQFRQAEPMPAYLFTAVAAELTVFEADWNGKSVRYLVPVGHEEAVSRAMGKTPLMMDLFSKKTGVPYPWPRYDQVVVWDFIFGGMENTGCTTMTDLLLVDDLAVLEWDPDGLVAHELAHQWFGDLVTCKDWSQSWLNESWATFMEAVWWEEDRDADEAIWYRYTAQQEYIEEYAKYRRPLVSYDFKEPIDMFDRHLYQKGSCVLWTLRGLLGDASFWNGVKSYLQTNAQRSVHSHDFQRALERSTGMNLDRFFKQWVHTAGHPVLDLTMSQGEGTVELKITQTQEADDLPKAFAFSLPIEVITSEGTTQHLIEIAERKRLVVLPVQGAILQVRIDPGLKVLSAQRWKAPRAWMVASLADACPVNAVRAACALLDEGSVASTEAVRTAMTVHPFWGVRESLVTLLGKRGTASDQAALIDLLQLDKDPRVRRAAAVALGSFRRPEVADALIGVIDEPVTSWHLLGAALKSLGSTRDPRAADVIRTKLDQDSWAELVRARALLGLANTREADVLDTLVRYSRADQHGRVRSAAAAALASLGDRVPSVRDSVLERLVEMVDEPGYHAQLGTIGALAILGDRRAMGVLDRIHRSAPDGRTRRAAYEASMKIKTAGTSGENLEGLRQEVEMLKTQNAELLERIERIEAAVER